MPAKKDDKIRLSLALDESWENRLEKVATGVRLKKHALAQAAVEAVIEAIERSTGKVVMPLEFTVTHLPVAVERLVATLQDIGGQQVSRPAPITLGRTG